MIRTVVIVFAFAVLGFAPTGLASAAEAPTADEVKALLAKFQKERDEAEKSFSKAEIGAADEFAKRAEDALKDGNLVAAARLARDARWLVPFRPSGLPEHVIRVIGTARLRHSDRINGLSYSPDGERLASCSRDGTVRVWDLGNGREIVSYKGHLDVAGAKPEDVNVFRAAGVCFSPDGKTIVSSGGNEVHVWDAATGETRHKLKGHKKLVRAVAYGADNNTVVSGSDDQTMILWDVAKEKPVYTSPEQSQRIEGITVGSKGRMIATINASGEVAVYAPATDKKLLMSMPATDASQAGFGVGFAGDGVVTCGGDNKAKLTAIPALDGTGTQAGTTIRSYLGHSDKINALAVSLDGKVLVTGSSDKTVRIWEVFTGKQTLTFQGHLGWVTAVAIRPDGKQVASGGEDGSVRLWPLADADEHRAAVDAQAPLWSAAYSPDGSKLASGGADKIIRVYDANVKSAKPLTGHKRAVTAVAFYGNDKLVSAGGDALVKFWDIGAGTATDLKGHESAVLAVAVDEPTKLLVSGSVDRSVKGWDAEGKKEKWSWAGKSAVCAVAIRKGGKQVAVGTADGGLSVLALDGSEPKLLGSLPAHSAGVACVTYSADGSRLATCGGDGIVRIWNVPATGVPVALSKFEPASKAPNSLVPPVTAIAFSADGRYLAAGGADSITRVWDIQTGAEHRAFRGHTDWVTAIAFRPDGGAVMSAGVDKAVRIFETARPDSVASAGHALPARCIGINKAGNTIITGAEDKTVKVWDLDSGREIATLSGAADAINAVGFAGPDRVVAAGDDQRIRWWSLKPVGELRSASTGRVFNMAAAADGSKVAVVWARRDEKLAAFEIFPGDGSGSPTQVTEKGRSLTCASVSADCTIGITGGEDGVIRLWNLESKDRIGGDWPLFVKSAADLGLTPDKSTLIAIDLDGKVKIANVKTRESKTTFQAVSGGVNGIVVAPTGKSFATLSADGEVKVWDLEGKEIRAWKLPAAANAAAFTPTGNRLVTANRDGTLYVLELP